MSTYYSPRARVRLIVPAFGSSRAQAAQIAQANIAQEIEVRPKRVEVIHNDLHTADEATVSCDYDDSGIEPRLLRNSIIKIWIEDGEIDVDKDLPRFIGIVIDVNRRMNGESSPEVVLRAQDYTRIFLTTAYPTDKIPSLNSTIRGAWDQLCDNTGWWDADQQKIISTVSELKGKQLLIKDPALEGVTFADAVTGRVKSLGSLPVQNGAIKAWTVWQHIMLYLGAVSYIDGDKCVVTTTTEHYRNSQAAALVWGQNLIELSETLNPQVASVGMCLQSFDPLNGKMLEAFYPPPGDPRIKTKRTRATKAQPASVNVYATENSTTYEYYEYHHVHDQKTLDDCCRRAYEERVRQELQGTLRTSEMFVEDSSGIVRDLLDLRAGNTIKVVVDADILTSLGETPSDQRIAYMLSRGYSRNVAELIVGNIEALKTLDNFFHVKTNHVTLEEGNFEISLEFYNLISIDGVKTSDTINV